MKKVYKYEITPDEETVLMPSDSELLSVAFQGHHLCIWALVDTEGVQLPRQFKVFGTGHEVPAELQKSLSFIGTAHTSDGLVFHVFEIEET